MLDLMDYSHLQLGETQQGSCPTCGKRKFYVTRKPAGYAFICFRASCPTQGFAGSTAVNTKTFNAHKPESWMREYRGELFLPNSADLTYFRNRFGIHVQHTANRVRTTTDQRYAFILEGPDREFRGHVVRRPNWNDFPRPPRKDLMKERDEDYPKTLCYFVEGCKARGAWYIGQDTSKISIVEDCVSAMRVQSTGMTAYCLLGTDFRLEHLSDLQKGPIPDEYILALDPDAYTKSLQISERWGPTFPATCVTVSLLSDPKDYQRDEWLKKDLIGDDT